MKIYCNSSSTAASPEVKRNIKNDIWHLVNQYDYVNNSDSDEFYNALDLLAKKYAEYNSTFSSIKKRILDKEVWYD